MAGEWQFNAAEFVIIMLTYIGLGLPVGLPPQAELKVAQVLPEDGLYAVTWAGTEETMAPDTSVLGLLANPDYLRIEAPLRELIAARFHSWSMLLDEPWQSDGAKFIATHGGSILKNPTSIFLDDIVPPSIPLVPWIIHGGLVTHLPHQLEAIKADLLRLEIAIRNDPRKQFTVTSVKDETGSGAKVSSKLLSIPAISWFVSDQHLAIGLGKVDAKELIGKLSRKPPTWIQESQQQIAKMHVATISRINLGRVTDKLLAQAGPELEPLRKELRDANVGALVSTSGIAEGKPMVRTRLTLDRIPFNWQSLGQAPLMLGDLDGIPADALYAYAAKVSIPAAWDAIQAVMLRIDSDPQARDALIQEFRDMWGLDLRDDLLACFGSHVFAYYSPQESGSILAGPTIGLELADAEKFAASMEAILTKLDGLTQGDLGTPRISRMNVRGVDVFSLRSSVSDDPFLFSWCVTDNQLLCSLFPQNLRSRLSRGSPKESFTANSEYLPEFDSAHRVISYWYLDTARFADSVMTVLPWLRTFAALESDSSQAFSLDLADLPAAALIRPNLQPSFGWTTFESHAITVEQHFGIAASGSLASLPIVVATLVPAVHHAAIKEKYESSLYKLQLICNAVVAYANDKGRLPPIYSLTKDGKPGLSWRVLILPYLEEKALFDKFAMDEPWDSPRNRSLATLIPNVFRSEISKSSLDRTNFLAIDGENTAWTLPTQPITIGDVVDGEGITLLAVEADDDRAVVWTQPSDFTWQADDPTAGLGRLLRTNAFHAVFLDADATAISLVTDRSVIRALYTRNGSEAIDYSDVVKP